jgi:hypothetical protein
MRLSGGTGRSSSRRNDLAKLHENFIIPGDYLNAIGQYN